MIRVAFATDSLRITGHSASAPRGEDVVCAAVTALAKALVYGLETQLGIPVDVRFMEPGRLEAHWRAVTPESPAAILIATIRGSIEEIARWHPNLVELR